MKEAYEYYETLDCREEYSIMTEGCPGCGGEHGGDGNCMRNEQ